MVTRREFLQKSVLVTGGLAAGKLLVDPLAPVSARCRTGGSQRSWVDIIGDQIRLDRWSRNRRLYHPTQRGRGASRRSGNSCLGWDQ